VLNSAQHKLRELFAKKAPVQDIIDAQNAIPDHRWPRIINFYIDRKDIAEKLRDAYKEMGEQLCLKWNELEKEPDESEGVSYVRVFDGEGCWSYVGMQGGMQNLSIGQGCESKSAIIHEMVHALGLFHEQSRPDRDNDLVMFFENMEDGAEGQYERLNDTLTYGTPYDLTSIMHYRPRDFSKNGRKTFSSRNPGDEWLIWREHYNMTHRDRHILHTMYECDRQCNPKPACANGGYVDKSCQCVCPHGTEGSLCEILVDTYYPPKICPDVNITTEQSIHSPNYPNNYPKDLDCFTYIYPPAGKRVKVSMADFDVLQRHEGTCIWDVLEFRTKENVWEAEDSNKFCVKELENKSVEFSMDEPILMVFHTVYDLSKGFNGTVTFV